MISFVWSEFNPLYSGRGGTEAFIMGCVRELQSRNIPTRVITIGLGINDGREYHPGIEFLSLSSPKELSDLNDVLIYQITAQNVPTKHKSFVYYHVPPSADECYGIASYTENLGDSLVITNSNFMKKQIIKEININPDIINVVHPFADPVFSSVTRTRQSDGITKVLFAGRLRHYKGIYLLMESLHYFFDDNEFEFYVTNAGNQTREGIFIEKELTNHPRIQLIEARHTPSEMAELFASYDIVVMPSSNNGWHEAFGMVSVEAQHAGCNVIAAGADGLLETDCGGLTTFNPGDSFDLAQKIKETAKKPQITNEQRLRRIKMLTRAQTIEGILELIGKHVPNSIINS